MVRKTKKIHIKQKEKKEHTKEEYKEWLAKTAKKNRNNPNNSEQAFIDILDYFDIKYNFEIPIIYESKKGYIFDFYLNIDGNKYDIEIDGITHMNEDAKLRDEERDAFAKSHNIKVIRLNSYFVLYLRNIFKEKFTKESFLEWIVNGCQINLKDMSEYKEKYENIKIELDTIAKKFKKTLETSCELQLKATELELMISELTSKLNNILTTVEERKNDDNLDSMFPFDKNKCLNNDRDDLAKRIFEKYKAMHNSK